MKKKILFVFVSIILLVDCFYYNKNVNSESIGIIVNKEEEQNFPNTRNYLVSVKCPNANGSWDYESWSLKLINLNQTREKCNLTFKETYAITYQLNDGRFISSDDIPMTHTFDEELLLPTKEKMFLLNYEFVGWYDNINLSGNPITKIENHDNTPKLFYAKWKKSHTTYDYEKELISSGGATYNNGIWTFVYEKEGNKFVNSKIQLLETNGIFLDLIFRGNGLKAGFFVQDYVHTRETGNYLIEFGANGTLYDAKPGFLMYLEKNRKYRFSLDIMESSPLKIKWQDFNFEVMD